MLLLHSKSRIRNIVLTKINLGTSLVMSGLSPVVIVASGCLWFVYLYLLFKKNMEKRDTNVINHTVNKGIHWINCLLKKKVLH